MSKQVLELSSDNIYIKGRKIVYKDSNVEIPIQEPELLQISSLRSSLMSRGWLCEDFDACDFSDPNNFILKRKISNDSNSLTESTNIVTYDSGLENFISINNDLSTNSEDYEDTLNEFLKLYEKYIMIKEDNIGEYNKFISSRDILNGTSEICVTCPSDGSYTNILNLNSFKGTPINIRVGIMYSKGEDLYTRDEIIPAIDKYMLSGSSDYTLEYSDKCLRVFPESSDITECVISYCFLTYECLI